MVCWFRALAASLLCLCASGAWAWSCAPVLTLYDTQDDRLVSVGVFAWDDAPASEGDLRLSRDRYRPITPAQSAFHYHAGPFAAMREGLRDGEQAFMGRFSLIRQADAARMDDIDEMYAVLAQWYDHRQGQLVGNAVHMFHDILRFEGHVLEGRTWVPFSSNNITYQVQFRASAYSPFFKLDGRPPLDRFEFGVFTLRAFSKDVLSVPTSTYLITNGSQFHELCPPNVRINFDTEEDNQIWEDTFKHCALAKHSERPETCWRAKDVPYLQ